MKTFLVFLAGLLFNGHSFCANPNSIASYAKAYGIIRYYSPNPYTEKWSEADWYKVCATLIEKSDSLPLDIVFQALAPDAKLSAQPQEGSVIEAGSNPCYFQYKGIGEVRISFLIKLLTKGGLKYRPYTKQLKCAQENIDDAPKPGVVYSYQIGAILSHMTSINLKTPTSEIPVSCWPFRNKQGWELSSEKLIAASPQITCPIVFLADERTISWGETILMMVKEYKMGVIIGMPTAGTTGDMTHIKTPIFGFTMTGMKMRNIDGTDHHGIGVLPDIVVAPTIDGLRQGNDEVLERAVAFLIDSPNN